MAKAYKGSCLCGGVHFTAEGPLRGVVACHCKQCRKQSGHYFAATNVADERLSITGFQNLAWYHASDDAKRGFCKVCGSTLFWKHKDDPFTSVLAGCLDGDTGLSLEKHIFCADKGDYYEIADGLPQFPQGG
ncbi:GFA family protein [Hoeflea prorocentri]|uniref:GFA family protein n=1 Tax=Hoeflea prorocentri TaxID=1922333 RepID=A0A9X3UG96_9HYPH|nr:GFA family protein [Hoeflea prorocentri]MCY6380305.1 GFA family protein [Hoeflea prorocentri]MDA5398105.1 GFA family protein [Hoeflea prorocentri]